MSVCDPRTLNLHGEESGQRLFELLVQLAREELALDVPAAADPKERGAALLWWQLSTSRRAREQLEMAEPLMVAEARRS